MVTRPHLPLLPANAWRRLPRRGYRRALAVAGAVLALVGLLYLAARETSLFAVERLEIAGAPPAVRSAVREAAAPYDGESLVSLDRADVARALAALPSVRSVRVDRAFPHTLRIDVVAERPLAVVRRAGTAWLVSERGRVLRRVEGEGVGRPRIRTDHDTGLALGEVVADEGVRVALAALRVLPDDFPVRVRTARAADEGVTLTVEDDLRLLLGEPEELALKLEVAGRVLESLSREERVALAYLDLSVPERPVGGETLDSQPEPETLTAIPLQTGI